MINYSEMVEIKILKQDERQKLTLIADSTDGKQYIKREIYSDKRDIYKTLQKIQHKNIPCVYTVDFMDSTVIIEEYINGQSLRELMEQKQEITKKQIKSVANQIVSAMSELHKAKIIHRDIKPDNILIDESGHIWIIDYEIARFYRDEIRKDTETLGTFGYAPPEQFGIMPTNYKTDIYAFGVTLTQLLEYSKTKGTLYKIADKCKRLDPAQRYRSADTILFSLKYSWWSKALIIAMLLVLIGTVPFM